MYFSWADLINEIPEDFVIQALDDADTAETADDVGDAFDALRTAASEEVDSYLEGRYATPLTGTIPNIVKRAALLHAAHTLYSRRGDAERFPKQKQLDGAISTLKAIRDGKTQLTPGRTSSKPRGAVVSAASKLVASENRLNS